MKKAKIVLVGAVLAFMAVAASAFDLTVGIKAGVGYPFYSGSDYDAMLAGGASTKFRLGFSVGAFATLGIIDVLAIQPEIMYSHLGGNFGDASAIWYDNANAIEIPLLLKLRLKMGSARFCPFAGADVLIKVGDWNFELKDSSETLIMSGRWNPQYIRVPIIGVVAGFGFDMPARTGWVTIDARYLIGVMNRFTDNSPIRDWRQNAIQLLLGYGFAVAR